MTRILSLTEIEKSLTAVCDQYEQSAPTVYDWADDLYRRLHANLDTVVLSELMAVEYLSEGGWMPANLAANRIYKLQHRLGRDVSGQCGF